MKKVKSCIKWTGGKYRELDVILDNLPDDFKTYVEPFVGGGALFWTLENTYKDSINYHINDINKNLINFYKILKTDYVKISNSITKHQHNVDYFIKVRDKFNRGKLTKIENASIFYYLNKTAFSGKYRVNSKGYYNNSWGNYKNITWDNIDKRYSESLQGVQITSECAINLLNKYQYDENAFIFLDPPYHNCDDMYNNPTQRDLDRIYQNIFKHMENSKAKILLIAGDEKGVRSLFDDFIFSEYEFKYMHNASAKRKNHHIIIRNY